MGRRQPVGPRKFMRRFVPVAAVLALPVLGGCASGFDAQTSIPYQPAQGISVRHGQVYVIDTLVVTNGHGSGTVTGALVNQVNSADALVGLTATDASGHSMKVTIAHGKVPVAGMASVQLADSGAVQVSDPDLQAGTAVTLTFTFEHASPVTAQVQVLPHSGDYASVPVG
ncbi:MAG: hypothetical protein ACRDQ1_08095 [Sciscionella sp.]